MYCIFSLVFLVGITTVLGKNCDKNGALVYEDLGCVPEKSKNEECPERYICNDLEPLPNNCLYMGKKYEDNEAVNGNVTILSCHIDCRCHTYSRNTPYHKFTCAALDCPEWLGYHPPRGCYLTYSINECCSVGKLCFKTDKIAECTFDGATYKEGQRFWPKDTCLECVCQEGFTGKLEAPFCRRQRCGTQLTDDSELVQKKCAPIYSPNEVLCCPNGWACPDETEKIEGDAISDNVVCQFGNKLIRKGQTIEKTNLTNLIGTAIPKVKCECTLPPLLKCLKV